MDIFTEIKKSTVNKQKAKNQRRILSMGEGENVTS